MSQFFNQFYEDSEGVVCLTLYQASWEDHPEREPVVVFYAIHDKGNVKVLSVSEFVEKYTWVDPYKDLTEEWDTLAKLNEKG